MKMHFTILITVLFSCACSQQVEQDINVTRSTKVEAGSPLYDRISALDAQLFDHGFNECDMQSLSAVTADDFEFYHDEAGTNGSKEGFIQSIDTYVCRSDYRAIRRIRSGTMSVFPLYRNQDLYGAIQTASHEFYARHADGSEELTDTARLFTLWVQTPTGWKMRRSFSFDHVSHN